MSTQICVGHRVKYSAQFLRSTGQFTGPMPFARGTVTAIKQYGRSGFTLVTIDWGDPEIPERVNLSNLRLITHIEAD